METIIGLKALRESTDRYIAAVKRGRSFVVVRKTKPVFKITPVKDEDATWEAVADFTKIKKGGVRIEEILSRF